MPVDIHNQRGLSLIEALIALLVLSIGLVGLGALMLTSLQNVHSSAHYSAASAVALDFEERIWSELTETVVNSPGNLGGDGCLTDTALDTAASATQTAWSSAGEGNATDWTDAERFNIPGLAIAVGDTTTTGVDREGDGVIDVNWKTVPITLTWTEGRFSDVADGQESYTATMTFACRPVFLL